MGVIILTIPISFQQAAEVANRSVDLVPCGCRLVAEVAEPLGRCPPTKHLRVCLVIRDYLPKI
jgi:hypothetical protein